MGKTVCRRKPSEAERRAWPRLSDIPGPRRPDCCQNCDARENLTAWQEHDHDDQPKRIVVVLCRSCASQMIGAHPRLYRPLGENEPWPGLMTLCRDCPFRRNVNCVHAKRKSGSLHITQEAPMHISMRPRSKSLWLWRLPATDCEGLHEPF